MEDSYKDLFIQQCDENREIFLNFTEKLKNQCLLLPQSQRKKFIEMSEEEITEYMALSEKHKILLMTLLKRNLKHFRELNNEEIEQCMTLPEFLWDNYVTMTSEQRSALLSSPTVFNDHQQLLNELEDFSHLLTRLPQHKSFFESMKTCFSAPLNPLNANTLTMSTKTAGSYPFNRLASFFLSNPSLQTSEQAIASWTDGKEDPTVINGQVDSTTG